MSIKQEDKSGDVLFSKLVHDQVVGGTNMLGRGVTQLTTGGKSLPPPSPTKKAQAAGQSTSGLWYLEDRIPTLGEVRGRIMILSRFGNGIGWEGGLGGMGVVPWFWPNSDPNGFSFECGPDTTLNVQDWYDIGNVTKLSQKFTITTSTMITNVSPSDPTSSSHHYLPLSFSSASSFPFALPSMVARGLPGVQGMNSRILQWAANILSAGGSNATQAQQAVNAPTPSHRVSGWLMMDYYDDPAGIIPLLVEMNYMNRSLGLIQGVGEPVNLAQ